MFVWPTLTFLIGLAIGSLVMWVRTANTRDAIHRLRIAAESRAEGDWKAHVQPAPGASEDARRLIAAFNTEGVETLRRLKDLSRRQEDLQALVNALPDAVLLADTKRKLILVNQPAEQLLGVPSDRALGQALEAAVA
ncbi:MAG: PAS domain-containing protein, partial [Planctomycetota bacterium]